METFLWHDYETWGVDPQVDRPAQFAAIRTDCDLNPVDEPVMFYAKPPRDCLVQPDAVMVTGITPQYADEHGLTEKDFIKKVRAEMMRPKTCSVGYNSIRFDDEVTRNTLYRNFHDPYEREYKSGNSRWDLIDVVRLCYALRPEGVEWPKDDQGLPVFRLEKLTEANGIEQVGAHDALVDVRATIALAKKIKDQQPKLFAFALSMKNKQNVARQLKVGSFTPIFHVSSMFGAINHCCSIVLPVAMHPTNKNEVICLDLRQDPTLFLSLDDEELKVRQFSSRDELAALAKRRGGDMLERLPIKNIHLNKSPMIAPVSSLTDAHYQRLQIDPIKARQHMEALVSDRQWLPKLLTLFSGQSGFASANDPDRLIYSGGFFKDHDKQLFSHIQKLSPEALAAQVFSFIDSRLPEMLFRYRGRNFPDSLNKEERIAWQQFCHDRVRDKEKGASICIDEYRDRLKALRADSSLASQKVPLIDALASWLDDLSIGS